jgi:anti-sigma factor (TIGR02949 family)
MSCAVNQERLSAYVDGELPPDQAAEIAEHLSSCDVCAREYEATLEIVSRLRNDLARYRAPDVLRARIRTAIREERPERAPAVRKDRRVPWRAVAAALIIAAASSGLTLLAPSRHGSEPAISEEVLASHIRSLMPDHLTDVRSSDQHNVKPWFDGRIDFSPAVPRLDDEGFPLLGGRLDYIHGRPVAVVVYGRRQHVINIFSWPAASGGDANVSQESRHGYTMLHWRLGGAEYWVVSDLNVTELQQFATLLRQAEPTLPHAGPDGR